MEFVPEQIMLIKATVYDVCTKNYKKRKLPIVNRNCGELLFLSSTWQCEFHQKFRNLVDDGKLKLINKRTISQQ